MKEEKKKRQEAFADIAGKLRDLEQLVLSLMPSRAPGGLLEDFVETCLAPRRKATCTNVELFHGFLTYCRSRAQEPPSQRAFLRELPRVMRQAGFSGSHDIRRGRGLRRSVHRGYRHISIKGVVRTGRSLKGATAGGKGASAEAHETVGNATGAIR